MTEDKTGRSLVEVFGYSPTDTTPTARKFWQLNACPFIGKSCSKYDHTNTICYGTCSVTNTGQNVVICPNRLYADGYATLKRVSTEVFGYTQFMLFDEYIKAVTKPGASLDCVVALGQNSGKEVKLRKMSMDWVLAHIIDGALVGYVGIEVQSIDITGNYRDAWYAARDQKAKIPPSAHGLNWANVHKRLIPQIIRKSLVYSKSSLVTHGLYFIVPEPVYQRFEEIIGDDIPLVEEDGKDIITVHTYDLGVATAPGATRALTEARKLKFKMDEFSARFIAGPNLPSGEDLDSKIREILSCR
ncbi:MAG: restriction endonuclease [Pseudomonadota bacterium]